MGYSSPSVNWVGSISVGLGGYSGWVDMVESVTVVKVESSWLCLMSCVYFLMFAMCLPRFAIGCCCFDGSLL